MSELNRSLRIAMLSVATVLTAFAQRTYAADKVTFVTDFGFNGRHAYYYVALEKGYYKSAGLEVEIVRGQGSADAIKQVAAGTAQIGFADAAAVILGRGNDQIPVKLVSVIYAKPPHAIYTLKGSGIATPKDLEGKKIADTAFSAIPKMFDAYAKAAKIDPSKVTWIIAAGDALPGILNLGRADGIGQFIVGEALLKKAAGDKELIRLAYADVGLDYYSNGIIATDELIKSNPDLIRRFVNATLRGLKDAMANPGEAGAIINKYHRQIDVDVATAETQAVASLAAVRNRPLGGIDPAAIQRTLDIITGAYQLKTAVKPNDIFASGFVAN